MQYEINFAEDMKKLVAESILYVAYSKRSAVDKNKK